MRQTPDDDAGVLSPPATMVVLLALMVVIALSVRTVAATGAPVAERDRRDQPAMSASSGA